MAIAFIHMLRWLRCEEYSFKIGNKTKISVSSLKNALILSQYFTKRPATSTDDQCH